MAVATRNVGFCELWAGHLVRDTGRCLSGSQLFTPRFQIRGAGPCCVIMFPLPPAPSALALDIDGTITTADQRVVFGLVAAARALGAEVAINTARAQAYCDAPDELTTRLTARENHYCASAWVLWNILIEDIPARKVTNMDRIVAGAHVQRRSCALLVDDRLENVAAANRAGYTGILVDGRTGITPRTAQRILEQLRVCAQ